MADDAGQPQPDLTGAGADALPDRDTDFFQMLRVLERAGGRFGRSADPGVEPARLGQAIRLSFATRNVAAVRPGANGAPPRIDVQLLGLLGPEGPMPLHLTRWTLDRLSERWYGGAGDQATADTTFVDLCNLLQHRMMTLYWRAWADTRAEVEAERGGGRVRAMLAALGGIGMPGTAIDPDLDPIKLRQAAALAQAAHGPERLTLFLTEMLAAPVELVEFVGTYVDIPQPLQTRLGDAFCALGRDAVAGQRVFQRQTRAELRVGPLTMERFSALFPGTAALERVKKAVLFVHGQAMTIDLRLVLAAAEVPRAQLGACALGRTAWLPQDGPRGDADDLRIARLVGAAPAAGMAA